MKQNDRLTNDKPESLSTFEVNEYVSKINSESGLKTFYGSNKHINVAFCDYLNSLFIDKGKSRKDIAESVPFARSQLDSLCNGTKKPVNRVHILSIGIALELSYQEMNQLLKVAHLMPLDAKRSIGDAIVIYGLGLKMKTVNIDLLLDEHKAEYRIFKKD